MVCVRIEQGGQAMLVLGEAGIGKSALLDETARRAEADGIRVLRTVLRDHRSGLSGHLVQSVRKGVHAGDRMGSTA